MKKELRRLHLTSDTLRVLAVRDLRSAVGGATPGSANCSNSDSDGKTVDCTQTCCNGC